MIGVAPFAIPQFEVAFHPLLIVERGLEVGAHRHAHRAVIALFDSERQCHAGRDAVCSDNKWRAGFDFFAGAPEVFIQQAGLHTDDSAWSVVPARAWDGAELVDDGAGLAATGWRHRVG